MVVLLFMVRLIELVVSELPSHPVNSYPSLGVAVTVTVLPVSYSPLILLTVPPSPAVTLKVYFTTGVGVTGLLMGVDVEIDGVEVSSEEQDKTIAKMLNSKRSFFI